MGTTTTLPIKSQNIVETHRVVVLESLYDSMYLACHLSLRLRSGVPNSYVLTSHQRGVTGTAAGGRVIPIPTILPGPYKSLY